jgi:energy-coupling factor transporter transmembrane protein EcfT
MKITQSPSRLPVRKGAWMLAWKDVIQSRRSLRVDQVLRWGWIFLLSLGIFLAPGWQAQTIIGGTWAVSLGGMATDRLRKDLARWWLLRSLPVRADRLLLADLGPACGLGLLLGWLALGLASPPPPFGWLAAALLPFLAASAALGTARDILDHAKARLLLAPGWAEENVPRQDIQGVLIILFSVGLPLGLLTWGSFHPGGFAWELLSIPAAALIVALIFQSTLSVYRGIM